MVLVGKEHGGQPTSVVVHLISRGDDTARAGFDHRISISRALIWLAYHILGLRQDLCRN